MSLRDILEKYRQLGVFSHAYAAYGRLSEREPIGAACVGPDKRDVFDLASLTKALVTVPLIFEQGLDLEGTVFDWAPSLIGILKPELGALRIRALLRHESGLPAWRNFWVCRLNDSLYDDSKRFELIVERLNRVTINPGIKQVYSDVGFILLGLVLESRQKADLSHLYSSFSCELGFLPSLRVLCVPTAYCRIRERLLVGEPHDENCAAMEGISGHCGLFGTGSGLCRFLHDYFYRTTVGQKVLAAQVQSIVPHPIEDPTQDSLLGWRQGSGGITKVFGGGKAIGHPGFTGTAFWIDPLNWNYLVLLTNRVLYGRTDLERIAMVRRDIYQECNRLLNICDMTSSHPLHTPTP